MHARYYNPNVARFLSVDPGRDVDPKVPQAWNIYAYVRGNPVRNNDPNGRQLNPVTGRYGLDPIPRVGVAGTIRRSPENPRVGLFDLQGQFRSTGKPHYGLDLTATQGTPLVASKAGRIVEVGENSIAGLFVRVQTNPSEQFRLVHLSGVLGFPGTEVRQGQTIAVSGITGNAQSYADTASQQHVHLEVKQDGGLVDPKTWLDTNAVTQHLLGAFGNPFSDGNRWLPDVKTPEQAR